MQKYGEQHQTQTEQVIFGFHQCMCAMIGGGKLHLLFCTDGGLVVTLKDREQTIHATNHGNGGQQIEVSSKFLCVGLIIKQKFRIISSL
jgi:hypothetical protein